ncbi:MAG: hypothetical protein QW372_03100 [Nitrososphaerales archaeon]
MGNLREEFLELLRTDQEFRYAVLGLLGLDEIIKRLDAHGAKLAKYGEILVKQGEELIKLREDMMKSFAKHDEEFAKVWNEMAKLREDMRYGFELIEKRLSSVERDIHQMRTYIERTSLTLEEEAFEVISGKLIKMGIKIALNRLILPDLELNIYGVADEICVIGEATIRAGIRIVTSLNEKVNLLIKKYPELVRPKMIKILYTMWITEEALEEAKRSGIWVLKAMKELTPSPLS